MIGGGERTISLQKRHAASIPEIPFAINPPPPPSNFATGALGRGRVGVLAGINKAGCETRVDGGVERLEKVLLCPRIVARLEHALAHAHVLGLVVGVGGYPVCMDDCIWGNFFFVLERKPTGYRNDAEAVRV